MATTVHTLEPNTWTLINGGAANGTIKVLKGSHIVFIQKDETTAPTATDVAMAELSPGNEPWVFYGVPSGEGIWALSKGKLRSPLNQGDKPSYANPEDIVGLASLSVTDAEVV